MDNTYIIILKTRINIIIFIYKYNNLEITEKSKRRLGKISVLVVHSLIIKAFWEIM